MRKVNRVTMIGLLVLGAIVVVATSRAQSRPPILGQVAKAYGLDSWDNITAIRYTWHAQFPGVDVSRTGLGSPRLTRFPMRGKTKTVSR